MPITVQGRWRRIGKGIDMPRKYIESPAPILTVLMDLANAKIELDQRGRMQAVIAELFSEQARKGVFVSLGRLSSLSASELAADVAMLRNIFKTISDLAEADEIVSDPRQHGTPEYYQASGLLKSTRLEFPRVSGRRQLTWSPSSTLAFEYEEQDLWGYLIDALLAVQAPTRIRACKICGDVYWVRRLGQKTCGPTHATAWRSRVYYNRHHRKEPTRKRE